MKSRMPFLAGLSSLGAIVAGSLASGFNVPALDKGPPGVMIKEKKRRPKAKKVRGVGYLKANGFSTRGAPNTVHGCVHNGTAFIYNTEREAARRVRQHEARFQKALDRLGPVDSAAEFG